MDGISVHDPLCLYDELTRDYLCACPLIRRVRADELEHIETDLVAIYDWHHSLRLRPGITAILKVIDRRKADNADR